MHKWFKINLLPLGPYFFGQDARSELGNRQMYFRRSAAFPSQSTLLGVMRHQLLLQHGLAIPRVNPLGDPEELIGKIGFKPGQVNHGYGKIKSLSPVFLQQNGEGHYFLRDREWGMGNEGKDVRMVDTGRTLNYRNLGVTDGTIPIMEHDIGGKAVEYTAKSGFEEYLHDPTMSSDRKVKFEKVIGIAPMVGVYKFVYRNYEHGDNEQGFFKNVFRRLEKEWSFAFQLEMTDCQSLQPSGPRVVIMGKERSAFLISIEPLNTPVDFSVGVPCPGTLQKILLLSDAEVDEARLLTYSELINGDTVSYRSITKAYRKNASKWYANLNRKRDLSASCNLLRRGTVIYTKQADQVVALLKENTSWHQIGNNHYTILPA